MEKDELIALLEGEPKAAFEPYVHVSRDADALNFYFRPDADYSKRLSDHVTLFLSLETNEIVGCRIKGVQGILENLPNYIHVDDNGVRLSIVFLAFLGSMQDEARDTLGELAKAAGDLLLEGAYS